MSGPARHQPWWLLTGGIPLAVYLWTLAPSVSYIDAGELAAVACLFGVAHPTGYPLFTLLGRLAVLVPSGVEPIVLLNALAALLTALGAAALFSAFRILMRTDLSRTRRSDGAEDSRSAAAAAAGALVFAFTRTPWSQAVAVEVYSLHILFLGVILLSVALSMEAFVAGEPARHSRLRILTGFLVGLSFTNHMTTLLLIPGLVVAVIMTEGVRGFLPRRVLPPALAGVAGLSLYLVLPLRAARGPVFNWGDVTTWERLVWHITGKQYRVWIFVSGEAALRKLEAFVLALPGETGVLGLLAAAAGLVLLWRDNKRLASLTLTFFLFCILYAVNYNIQDIEPYYLLAYVMVAFWAGWAFRGIALRIPWRGAAGRVSLAALPGVVALLMVLGNYPHTHQRGNHLVEDMTKNVLDPLPENAVVFSYQWDYWVSASYYYQYVRGFRPDVVVVDKELLRRSWYLKELEQRAPWLMQRVGGEVQAFRRELEKFEHGRPYNPAVIQARFEGMIRGMIRASSDRAVFVTPEIEKEFTVGHFRVPEGLVFRLRTDGGFYPTPDPDIRFRPFGRSGRYENVVRSLYEQALRARSGYYRAFGREAEAGRALEMAARFAGTAGG